MAPPRATPHIKKGVITASSTVTIRASPDLIFATLRDTGTWAEWCSFVPRAVVSWQPPSLAAGAASSSGLANAAGDTRTGANADLAPRPQAPRSSSSTSSSTVLQLGTHMTEYARMSRFFTSPTPVEVNYVREPSAHIKSSSETTENDEDAPRQIHWRLRSPIPWLLDSERVNMLRVLPQRSQTGEVVCEYTSYETFAGVLTRVMRLIGMESVLQRRFEEWGADLRKYCEAKQAERHGS